jgi:protein disulfide isomerase
MKLNNFFFLSAIIHSICVDKFPLDREVITLTDSTYEKAIKQYKYLIIYFYAPWCGHCRTFDSEYEKAADTLKEDNIHLAKIDGSTEKRALQKFKVNGFPSILFFLNGEPIEFEGARTSRELTYWARKKIGEAFIYLNDKKDLEKFKKENEICFVYFGDDEKEIKTFEKASKLIEEFPFAIVKNEQLIKKYTQKGTIVLFKHFDEKKNELKNINLNSIQEFAIQYALPKVMVFNDRSVQHIFQKKNPAVILYADQKSINWNKYGNIMIEVSEKIKRKMAVVLTDIKEGISARLAEYVGIKEKDLPLVSILDTRKDFKKYNMEEEITVNNILKFIDKWEKNKLKRELKSEKEPKMNNGNVFIVVGKTFEKEVINNDKDVMLLFYAPWCAHCKELSPKYEEVAKKLKAKNPKLLIAKIDGSENDVESISITGFPTLMFFPGNKKNQSPIEYKGKRNTADIISFIKYYSYNKVIDDDEDIEEEEEENKIDENKNNTKIKKNEKITDL